MLRDVSRALIHKFVGSEVRTENINTIIIVHGYNVVLKEF